LAELRAGKGLALAIILKSSGSTPREAGSSMLIRADGSIVGTVGGGVMEAHILRAAGRVIKNGASELTEYVLEETGAAAIGAVCGGRATILVDFYAPEQWSIAYFERLLKAAESDERSYMAVALPRTGPLAPRNSCLVSGGALFGAEGLDADAVSYLSRSDCFSASVIKLETCDVYLFPVGTDGTVYIFGAGHCGEKLAHIAHTVGFVTVVIDDRSEFANRDRIPDADELIVPESIEKPFDTTQFGADSYIVIVTRGHMHDEVVLRRALKTNAGYIGMIGSKKKRETIYSHLLSDGYTQDDIDRVCSPIGIAIGAETPEEIAVSITAELIKVAPKRGADRRGGVFSRRGRCGIILWDFRIKRYKHEYVRKL
jgi:xanthine dehydrogenase accessory factor